MDYNSVSVKLPKDNQPSLPGDNTPAVDWLHDPANASDPEFGQCVSPKGVKVDIDKYMDSLEVIDGKEIRTVKSKINGKILMEFNKKTGILTVKSESGDRKVDLSEAAFSKFKRESGSASDNKYNYNVRTECDGNKKINFWHVESDGTFGKMSKDTYECGQACLPDFKGTVDDINSAETHLYALYGAMIVHLIGASLCAFVAAGVAYGLTILEIKSIYSTFDDIHRLERNAEEEFMQINEYSTSAC